MNIKFEYNAITEGGQALVPASGPGLIGLKNGGNFCYMSSVLQALWGLPALGHTYATAAEQIMSSAPADVVWDFTAQLAKVGHALTTGAPPPSSAALTASGRRGVDLRLGECVLVAVRQRGGARFGRRGGCVHAWPARLCMFCIQHRRFTPSGRPGAVHCVGFHLSMAQLC